MFKQEARFESFLLYIGMRRDKPCENWYCAVFVSSSHRFHLLIYILSFNLTI